MRLSTRSRYGLRALLDIANHDGGGPVRLKEIAARQGVSLSYLEHIVGPLVSRGIVRSTRGIGGGVSLGRPPEEIGLHEAVTVLEGPVLASDCVREPGVCPRAATCATRSLWVEMTEAMNAVLGSRTVADLLAGDDNYGLSSCAPDAMRPMQTPVFGGGAVALGRESAA
jgi:Rrf2 family protein